MVIDFDEIAKGSDRSATCVIGGKEYSFRKFNAFPADVLLEVYEERKSGGVADVDVLVRAAALDGSEITREELLGMFEPWMISQIVEEMNKPVTMGESRASSAR